MVGSFPVGAICFTYGSSKMYILKPFFSYPTGMWIATLSRKYKIMDYLASSSSYGEGDPMEIRIMDPSM